MTIIVPQWVTLGFAFWGFIAFVVQLVALIRCLAGQIGKEDPGPQPVPPRKTPYFQPLCGCKRCIDARAKQASQKESA